MKKLRLEDFELIDLWNEFIEHVVSMENEVALNAKGNVAAGIRFRHAIVTARKMLAEMRRRTCDADKERKRKRHRANTSSQ